MRLANFIHKGILPLSAALLLFCCNFNRNKKADKPDDTEQPASFILTKKDTLTSIPPSLLLKNSVIDEKYFERQTKLASVLTKEQFTVLGAHKLMPDGGLKYGPEMKLKIIDTLFSGNYPWIIVSRETENEQWAWLAVLDDAKEITRSYLIFYQDFVEYFSATSSRVTDTTVVITTVEDNGENKSKKVEKLRFTDIQQLKLVN